MDHLLCFLDASTYSLYQKIFLMWLDLELVWVYVFIKKISFTIDCYWYNSWYLSCYYLLTLLFTHIRRWCGWQWDQLVWYKSAFETYEKYLRVFKELVMGSIGMIQINLRNIWKILTCLQRVGNLNLGWMDLDQSFEKKNETLDNTVKRIYENYDIFIDNCKYLYTNIFKFYYNSNSISYFNSKFYILL